MAEPAPLRILSDTWYGRVVGADVAGTNTSALRRWRTTLRMCLRSRDYDLVLTSQGTRRIGGVVVLAGFLALTGRRRLVLTEFMPSTVRPGLKGAAAVRLYRLLLGRAVARIQVMTEWEREEYAERFRIPPERIVHVPFYWFDDRVPPAEPIARSGAMASGRNSCDWETFFAGLGEQGVPLTAVCDHRDAESARRSATPGSTVLVEVPREEHDRLLSSSELYVLALKDTRKSTGHVRLASAATRGTPVIASDVAGIRGYEHLAVAVVPPGRPEELAETAARLLADPAGLRARAEEVGRIARSRPYSRYVEEMRSFVLDSPILCAVR